jgi:PAS domain S-box-containing protein
VDLNLSYRTYVNNGWDHVVVLDVTGQVLIAQSADRRALAVGKMPDDLTGDLAALAARQTGRVAVGWGMVLAPRPLWVAVHTVLDSHLRGPPRGHFLVARELPANFIRAWEAKHQLRLRIGPPPDRQGQLAGQGPALWELHRPDGLDPNFPAGEIDLVDPLGQVQGLVQLESQRPHLRDARRQLLTILPLIALCLALALGAGLYFGRRHDRETLYESVAAVSTDAVILADHRGRVIEINSGARAMFGCEPEEVVGHPLERLLPRAAATLADRPLAGPHPPVMARRRDGTEFPADLNTARIRSGRDVITAVTLRDLSERLALEQARVTQGHRLDLALRAANAGTWRWNHAKRETWWSDAMHRLHGLPPQAGAPTEAQWLDAIHPDDRARIAAEAQAMGPLGRVDMIYRVLLPDGALRWLHNLGEAERDADGRATPMWNGIIMDVTERQEAAERLRMNEQRYRAIIENQEDAVCRWLPDTTLTFANGRYRELFGIPDGDLQGRRWIDYVPEGERADVTRTYEELVRRPRNLTYEHSVRLADGQTRWVLWVDVPLPDADGVCREFQSVGRDITERKLAEQALRESEERYRRIVDTAREGIWMLDAQMKTTFANQRMAELLGLSVAALSGRSLLDFVEPSSREEARSHFEQCRAGLLHQCDLHLRLPDGSTLWTLVSANPIRDAAGVSVGLLALVTDITDRKGMEADLQAREALFRTVFESAPLGIALAEPRRHAPAGESRPGPHAGLHRGGDGGAHRAGADPCRGSAGRWGPVPAPGRRGRSTSTAWRSACCTATDRRSGCASTAA